ncbi:ribonuclease D [Amylibacter marinus]|nr:ribonuclease D [Amylibacter marinus]
MKIIKNTQELAAFCETCSHYDYVTIDTEFLRERTYYSKLCLVQMAHPGEGPETAALIDPLADGISLDPLYDLFQNPSVTKVFHAARQDLEIFFVDKKILPKPFFDTQIAAMVCGFGEQVGYEKLVRAICNEGLDKSSRFTDWSARPLSDKQKNYAIGDVTHLRQIYEFLAKKIHKSGRQSWVEEELAILMDPKTYVVEPSQAWRRIKTRSSSWKMIAAVQELAKFRESLAQSRNIPRNRIYKDDALLELAATRPKNIGEISKSRLLLREARKGQIADGILAAIAKANTYKSSDVERIEHSREKPMGKEGLAELLRVLLKAKAEEYGVAQKLIATSADLDQIALGTPDQRALTGWRAQVFGNDAQKLCQGDVALSSNGKNVVVVNI